MTEPQPSAPALWPITGASPLPFGAPPWRAAVRSKRPSR